MDVSKELKSDIERNQNQLKIAIRNHQMLVLKLKTDPENTDVKFKIKAAQNDIISIGLDQKELIERLRRELKIHHRNVKQNATKTGIEDRRSNLSTILSKARKQNLTVRSTSVSSASTSEDSLDIPSSPPSPNPPLLPHELTQVEFLGRMGLCTHDVFKELQNKRVERKRRSTANPHFLYGNTKCKWDQSAKRKKNAYLISSLSPPNTRQAVKNKQKAEQRAISPPTRSESRSCSPAKNVPVGFPNIPNLPSGLTIERISYGNNRSSPDNKVCVICRQPGALLICETCNSNYHVTCHNRPLVQQPKHCPKCLGKKETVSRDVGSLNVPPSMTVLATYVSAEVKEKADEKKALIEKNKTLNAELAKLEERAAELTVSLKTQDEQKEELLSTQNITKQNIQRLLDFVNAMKGTSSPRPPSIKSEES